MARSLLTIARRIQYFNIATSIRLHPKSVRMASNITEKEKELTGSDRPVKGGPTAQAQKHTGDTISSSAVPEVTEGERKITGEPTLVQGGPAAAAQSHLSQNANNQNQHAGKLDSSTISSITDGEKRITGGERVKGGPTAQAQSDPSKSLAARTRVLIEPELPLFKSFITPSGRNGTSSSIFSQTAPMNLKG